MAGLSHSSYYPSQPSSQRMVMEEILKILVVDDDEVDRMAVCRSLKAGGVSVQVWEVSSCTEAIAALQTRAFDCAFVDYLLPDSDGLTLVQSVRRLGIQVPFILLTGQGDEQIAVELMKAGASDYLSKSRISPIELCRSLHNAVTVHRAEIEAKQANQKLQESEERYRLVLEGSNDGIWDWDITQKESYCNDRFFEILGLPRAEFSYSSLEEFYKRIHPEDQQRMKDAIVAHLERGVEYNIEFRICHASGEYRYCSCRGKAQRNEQGIPIRVAGIISDITERKQAEAELLKQQSRSQLLAEMTLKIRQSLQIEEILQTTVQEVLDLLVTDRVLIYRLWQDGSGTVVTEATVPGCTRIVGENITDPCFQETYLQQYRQGRVKAINDLDRCDMQPCHVQLLQRFGVKANLVVPIIQREELWGLLIAHQCTTARQWTPFEIELLQQLADQVGIALAQAQLLEQETRSRQQLAEQNTALEQALKYLQQTQAQLIQSEKMSGLGQLVAGVAHEINNPVTFIYSNITPAQQYIQDLLDLLDLYQQHYPQPVPDIQAAIAAIDLDFLISDLVKLLSSMKVGAERIRKIVSSLRNFSRHDEAQIKAVDINEGLDNTLLLLQHRLQRKAEHSSIKIVKEYGDLPLVECLGSQMNQVFMNIISNAIDALEEKGKERKKKSQESESPNSSRFSLCSSPTIRISTRLKTADSPNGASFGRCHEVRSPTHIVISIADNGPGMKEEVVARLFDPFFTTKPVGKGTGLGLSVSYQIVVEKHRGQLKCISAPDEGAEFEIEIPICALPITSSCQGKTEGESCPVVLHGNWEKLKTAECS